MMQEPSEDVSKQKDEETPPEPEVGYLKATFRIANAGFRSALRFDRSLKYIATLQTTSISTRQCFLLNGTIYLGSIVMFNFFLTPLLVKLAELLCGFDKEGCNQEWRSILGLMLPMSGMLFKVLWLVPMYILSFILNAVFYFDMAKEVYIIEYGKPRSGESIYDTIRDSLYNHLLMAWVSIGSWVLYYVPYIGPLFSLLYTSWAVAFYAFDYKWTLDGWDLQKRLRVFQAHYIYMLGFGIPCGLITQILPQFLGYGVYCVVFPVCMIIAIVSTPVQHKPNGLFPRSIRMFIFAEWINYFLVRLVGIRKTGSSSSAKKR